MRGRGEDRSGLISKNPPPRGWRRVRYLLNGGGSMTNLFLNPFRSDYFSSRFFLGLPTARNCENYCFAGVRAVV